MFLVRLLAVGAAVTLCTAQIPADEDADADTADNVTSAELELFNEAADYLLELHEFFTEFEKLKAQSKAEGILQDAFSSAFTNVVAIMDKAEKMERPNVLECIRKVEEDLHQVLDEERNLLGKCYALEVDPEEEAEEYVKNVTQSDEQEEALRQEVADFLQVAVNLLELVSEETAMILKHSEQVRQAIAQEAILLARNFQKTRVKVRNCVDLELEEAYKKGDVKADDAKTCLLLDYHEEL